MVEADTIVMIEGWDFNPPDIVKSKKGGHDIDKRMVDVIYLTGPLSGRWGMIERYKIQPIRMN